jgi:hypothetical protein
LKVFFQKDRLQGDQIGRIFANWATLVFGKFLEKYKSSTNFGLLFTSEKVVFYFDQKKFSYMLGVFFANSSGHPVSTVRDESSSELMGRFFEPSFRNDDISCMLSLNCITPFLLHTFPAMIPAARSQSLIPSQWLIWRDRRALC